MTGYCSRCGDIVCICDTGTKATVANHETGAVGYCPACYAPAHSSDTDPFRDLAKAYDELKAEVKAAEKQSEEYASECDGYICELENLEAERDELKKDLLATELSVCKHLVGQSDPGVCPVLIERDELRAKFKALKERGKQAQDLEVNRLRGLIRAWAAAHGWAHPAWKRETTNAALFAEAEKDTENK